MLLFFFFYLYSYFTETGRFGLRSFPGHFDVNSLDLHVRWDVSAPDRFVSWSSLQIFQLQNILLTFIDTSATLTHRTYLNLPTYLKIYMYLSTCTYLPSHIPTLSNFNLSHLTGSKNIHFKIIEPHFSSLILLFYVIARTSLCMRFSVRLRFCGPVNS